jgi:SAM-dependent methyltransferase
MLAPIVKKIFKKNPEPDEIVYSLDRPYPHLIQFNAPQAVSGFVFSSSNIIEKLEIKDQRGRKLADCPVNFFRKEVADHLPDLRHVHHCGFETFINLDDKVDSLEFFGMVRDGGKISFLKYNLNELAKKTCTLWHIGERYEKHLVAPPPQLIYTTQGVYDKEQYLNSIPVSGVLIKKYLESAQINLKKVQTALDLGCGTGRVTMGLWLMQKNFELYGCDINEKLIDWNKKYLPPDIFFATSSLAPPLGFSDRKFDLIYLISVFTHLSLDSQREWVDEFRRLLTPRGMVVVTMHGPKYVELVLRNEPKLKELFKKDGYCEIVTENEGSNSYASFHRPDFARGLFSPLQLTAYYPEGKLKGQNMPFRLAFMQDVYVFRSH